MHFDFRPLFRISRNFRENIPIHRPRPSAGGALKEKRTPGSLVFGSRKASLLETWLLHLELVSWESIIRQWQRQVQGCASGPWRLAVAKPRLWLLGCYLWRVWLSTSTTTQGTEPEPNRNSLVPFSCRTPGGSGWQPFTYDTDDYNIQLSRNLREKNVTFANSKKTFARVSNITWNMNGFRN